HGQHERQRDQRARADEDRLDDVRGDAERLEQAPRQGLEDADRDDAEYERSQEQQHRQHGYTCAGRCERFTSHTTASASSTNGTNGMRKRTPPSTPATTSAPRPSTAPIR